MNKLARYLKAETIDDYRDYFVSEVIPTILNIDFESKWLNHIIVAGTKYNSEVDNRKTIFDGLEMNISVEGLSHKIQFQITHEHLPRDNNYLIKIVNPYQLREEITGRFKGDVKKDANLVLDDIYHMIGNALHVAKKHQML
jgi:hypothetical protein